MYEGPFREVRSGYKMIARCKKIFGAIAYLPRYLATNRITFSEDGETMVWGLKIVVWLC